MNEKMLMKLAGWLVVIGAIVVGAEGLLGLQLIDAVLGANSVLAKGADIVIGAAGLWMGYGMLMGKKK